MDNNKPKLVNPKSNLEKVLTLVSIIGIIINFIYLVFVWDKIPNTVPIHFGVDGSADGWGNKGSLIITPVIMTVISIFIIVLSNFPQYFNYAVTITKENAERQYKAARTLLLSLSVELVILFSYLTFKSVNGALGDVTGLGLWFLPVTLIVMFSTIGISIYRMIKLK